MGLRRVDDRPARWVELVWHGVNDAANLRELLRSDIRWAEIDVRRDPHDRIVLHHDAFTNDAHEQSLLLFDECVTALRAAGRSVKLDFKDDGAVARSLAMVDEVGFDASTLWFNSTLDCLGEEGFAELTARYPGVRMTCPVDDLVPRLLAPSGQGAAPLARLRACGVSRLSLSWHTGQFDAAYERLNDLGWDVNVYGVRDLAEFVQAVRLVPRSVTADFNFPEWGYAGRGSGAQDQDEPSR